MRQTSSRRHHGPRGFVYSGAGLPAKKTQAARSIALDADDPDAIQCGSCGAYVKRLANGRPRAHAAGGVVPSTVKGRYKCEGSGTS